MNSCFYQGEVMHQRFFPMQYRFKYKVLSLRIDVDELEQMDQNLKGFSLNRWNLMSIHTKDYASRDGKPWKQWAKELLAHYGIETEIARLELVCFPRFMGMVFNPLAMWYAYDAENQLLAVIGEVSNTFGHWHHYVLSNKGEPLANKLQAQAQKVFHVSPFINMDCHYRFRLAVPSEHYQLGIYQYQAGEPVLVATQAGKKLALNQKNFNKALLSRPFNTLKVVALIHWWALKIWLKGGRFHTTPKAQMQTPYSHTEMTLC